MRKINVGFLGCGNIGGGVWALLDDMRADIARCFQIEFDVKRMLVRALDEPRAVQVPLDRLTTNAADILEDEEIDLVCEYMGGEQPAADFMLRALKNGKSVVTANKMALSLHWQELHEAAEQSGAHLYYEASVCGAIPVIRTIRESMTGSRIDKIFGIVNGTTNYILTQMQEKGLPYEQALSQAQELGLAEPDPTSDVEGYDAAYKLSILVALCFGVYVRPNEIARTGITQVDIRDIRLGQQLGLRLKLLAQASCQDGRVFACVTPTFVTADNQLANVMGAFNGVLLHGHACDDIFLYGRGAGSQPTASAIVADMIQSGRKQAAAPAVVADGDAQLSTSTDKRYYIRLNSNDAEKTTEICQNISAKVCTLQDENETFTVVLTAAVCEKELSALVQKLQALSEQIVVWPFEGNV